MRILYLSYDGATDPLGQSQILPYLRGLAGLGYEIHLVTFEKPQRRKLTAETRRALGEAGIAWHPLSYTKRPPVISTMIDMVRLRRFARRLHSRYHFDLVHCRSYLPMLAALPLKQAGSPAVLFDMRGFWPDEKLDAGVWPQGNPIYRAVYRYLRSREVEFLRESDAIVVLTHKAKTALTSRPGMRGGVPVHVIPCSVDFVLFRPDAVARGAARRELGLDSSTFVLAYAGSLGTWYMLDEMLHFFSVLSSTRASARFLILTQDSPDVVLDAARSKGVEPSSLIVRAATRREMPRWLAAADAAISFIRPSPSKISSSPTKLGEYMAMDLPVVTNGGVGDVAEIIAETNGGVLVNEFTDDGYHRAVAALEQRRAPDGSRRERARGIYDLDAAVAEYDRSYRNALGGA